MLTLVGILSMVKSHWRSAAVIIGVFALAVTVHLAIRAHDRAQFNRGFNVAWTAGWQKQQIEEHSIATLTKALGQKNAETEERANAYAGSKASDAANTASNDAKQRADANRVATLQGIATGAAMKPGCVAPAALLTAIEGL